MQFSIAGITYSHQTFSMEKLLYRTIYLIIFEKIVFLPDYTWV